MSQGETPGYDRFVDSEIARLGRYRTLNRLFGLLMLLGVVILLWHLGSPWQVWVYVLVLTVVILHGLQRLDRAAMVTSEVLTHLREISDFLDQRPDREQLLAFMRDRATPGDRSNAPEALLALANSQTTGENVRLAANAAFVTAASELSFSAFMRSASVLGGLFGTVFFFAQALPGVEKTFQGASLDLSPLRGALASTLTGICGTILLGVASSWIEKVLDQAVYETEAFLGGEFSRCIAVAPARGPIVSETEMWESLREEVARMTETTTRAFDKMGDDAAAYAASLAELGRQLSALPAIQVPPELTKLYESVDRFSGAIGQMESGIRILVEAVGTLNLYVPAKLLSGLDAVQNELHGIREDAGASLRRNEELARQFAQDVSSFRQQLERVPEDMARRLKGIEEGEQETARQVQISGQAHARDLEAATRNIRDLKDRLGEIWTSATAATSGLSGALEDLRRAARELMVAGAGLQPGGRGLQAMNLMVDGIDQRLQMVELQLRGVEVARRWCQRAEESPLMRLLTISFRFGDGRRVEGDGDAPKA